MRYIESFLSHGSDSPKSAQTLIQLTGLSDTRTLSKLIENERREGVFILSNGLGYFLPSEDRNKAEAEIKAFYASMISRAKSILAVVYALKTAEINPDQLYISEILEDYIE